MAGEDTAGLRGTEGTIQVPTQKQWRPHVGSEMPVNRGGRGTAIHGTRGTSAAIHGKV